MPLPRPLKPSWQHKAASSEPPLPSNMPTWHVSCQMHVQSFYEAQDHLLS